MGLISALLALVIPVLLWCSYRRLPCLEVLPWDPANHALDGLKLWENLRTFSLFSFFAELFSQAYWPPFMSALLVPFYALFGPHASSAVLLMLTSLFFILWLPVLFYWKANERRKSLVAYLAYFSFAVSSLVLLRFSVYVMSEIPGALITLLAAMLYWRAIEARETLQAMAYYRWVAIASLALFLTKQNFGIQWIIPLVLTELFLSDRAYLGLVVRNIIKPIIDPRESPVTFALVLLCGGLTLSIAATGGWQGEWLGTRISMKQIANPTYALFAVLFMRFVILSYRNRLDTRRILPIHRVLCLWYGLPLALWFLYPEPNRFKVLLTRMGTECPGKGVLYYLKAFPTEYLVSSGQAIFLVVCLGIGIFFAWKSRSKGAFAILFFLIFAAFSSTFLTGCKEERLILNYLPVIFLWAAWGIGQLADWRKAGVILLVAILFPLWHSKKVWAQWTDPTELRYAYRSSKVLDMCPADPSLLVSIRRHIVDRVNGSKKIAVVGLFNMHWAGPLIQWELYCRYSRYAQWPRLEIGDFGYRVDPVQHIKKLVETGKLDYLLLVQMPDDQVKAQDKQVLSDLSTYLKRNPRVSNHHRFVLESLGYPSILYRFEDSPPKQ